MAEEPKAVFKDALNRIYGLYLKYGDTSSAIKLLFDLAYYASLSGTKELYLKTFERVLEDITEMYPARARRIALSVDKMAEKALEGPESQYVGDLMMEIITLKHEKIPVRMPGVEERLKRTLEELGLGGKA